MSEIIETRDVWVAWTNTDLTEGRGQEYPLAICDKKATAIRLGRKGSVQGSDCRISKEVAVKLNDSKSYSNPWHAPCRVVPPSKEDDLHQKRIDARDNAIKKAKDAGLTNDDLTALML